MPRSSENREEAEAMTDETDKKKPLESTLSEAKEREDFFRQIVQHIQEAIVIVDRSGVVRSLNPAAERLFNCPASDLVGKTLPFPVHSGKPSYRPIPFRQFNFRRPADGSEVVVEMRVTEVRLRGETYFMANLRDITELAKLRKKAEAPPVIDEITGLYNRHGLSTLLRYQVEMSKRTKRGMWLLVVNLDNLARISDVLGFEAGRRALLEVAEVLRGTFRASDVIARTGDGEFSVVAIGARKESGPALRERLEEKLKEYNAKPDRSFKLSVSIGMAYLDPENPVAIERLFDQARTNMLTGA